MFLSFLYSVIISEIVSTEPDVSSTFGIQRTNLIFILFFNDESELQCGYEFGCVELFRPFNQNCVKIIKSIVFK